MSFISSLRTRYLSWSHSTPLPDLPDIAPPVFQHWHIFDKSTGKWTPVQLGPLNNAQPQPQPQPQTHRLGGTAPTISQTSQTPDLQLLTWNIDAFGDRPESRMEKLLSKLQQMHAGDNTGPDIVFFQEVSRKALTYLLQNAWIKDFWISSEADETNWADVPFATMTLLSRSRFGVPSSSGGLFSLGPVWRVKYPSRFNRDALCCDIIWNRTARIRLVNVHLDSLPIQPNQRPRQVAIAANLLRTAGVGRGVIAGDWNPVTEEDVALARENNLIDAWEYLHPGESGFTWGLDGKGDPFPAARLDRVVVLGVRLVGIRVVYPETLPTAISSPGEEIAGESREEVPWSDHSGLVCSFAVSGMAGSDGSD